MPRYVIERDLPAIGSAEREALREAAAKSNSVLADMTERKEKNMRKLLSFAACGAFALGVVACGSDEDSGGGGGGSSSSVSSGGGSSSSSSYGGGYSGPSLGTIGAGGQSNLSGFNERRRLSVSA